MKALWQGGRQGMGAGRGQGDTGAQGLAERAMCEREKQQGYGGGGFCERKHIEAAKAWVIKEE